MSCFSDQNYFKNNNTVIKCPTSNHMAFLNYASMFCEAYRVPLILKGSLSKGCATPFSDIDIIIGTKDERMIDSFVKDYKSVIMSNYTERPWGILSIVYNDAICVDVDVRQRITKEEMDSGIVIVSYALDKYIGDNVLRVTNLKLSSIPERDNTYKILRLFHRSLIKMLCDKEKNALGLLNEIYEELNLNIDFQESNYKELIQKALNHIKQYYIIPDEIDKLLHIYINIL